MKLNKNIKIFVNYFLGPLLFAWLSYSIYNQLRHQPDLDQKWKMIRESFHSPALFNLLGAFALVFVNWGIESFKWKLSIRKVQRVSFLTAFKAILSGTSFSATTPNRVGEYLGRVLYMNEGNRLKAISLTMVGSMSQLLVTLFMGWTGLLLLRRQIAAHHLLPDAGIPVLIYGVLFVLLILTVFYFRLSFIIRWIDRLPGSKKYAWLIQGIEEFNATLMLQLLSLSAIRFLVFIIQYYLLFRLYNVDILWWQALWTVSVSFLAMAVFPTVALFTDLGLKGKINLKLIGLFSGNGLGISLTSASIWLINLIIPAVAGSLLILSIKKIFKNNNEERI